MEERSVNEEEGEDEATGTGAQTDAETVPAESYGLSRYSNALPIVGKVTDIALLYF